MLVDALDIADSAKLLSIDLRDSKLGCDGVIGEHWCDETDPIVAERYVVVPNLFLCLLR